MKKILWLLLIITIFSSAKLNNGVNISLNESDNMVYIDWQLINPKNSTRANIFLDNQEINITQVYAPNNSIKTSIYFLIDTSIPMKSSVNLGAKPLLKNIIEELDLERHTYAIAGFDKKLNKIKDFDEPHDNSFSSLDGLKVDGYRTEIYRLTSDALDELNSQDSERKILILISDGDFEDTTYTVSEVIEKANKYKIKILSFAYRDLVQMQGIQKPAIDTGGKMWVADKTTHKMPYGFMNELLPYFDNGGKISFSKENFSSTENGLEKLSLKVEIANSFLEKNFYIKVEKKLIEPITKVDGNNLEEENNYLLYLLSSLGLILALLAIFLKRKKEPLVKELPDEEKDEIKLDPIAYLISPSGEKYEIVKDMTSIGRNDDNDIVIDGTFISNYHADIIFKYHEFLISDKNSTNGIGVNSPAIKEGEGKVTQSKLNDGDIVYLGPLELVFKKEDLNNG